MRLAPLEDPTLPRGQALSQALAKQLSLLFFAVLQKACFAQLAVAAQHYGLLMRLLPDGLLSVSHWTIQFHCAQLLHSHTIAALSQCTQSLYSVLHTTLHSVVIISDSHGHCTQILHCSQLQVHWVVSTVSDSFWVV